MKVICYFFGHKYKFLFSHILKMPFKECGRCGDQSYLTKADVESVK